MLLQLSVGVVAAAWAVYVSYGGCWAGCGGERGVDGGRVDMIMAVIVVVIMPMMVATKVTARGISTVLRFKGFAHLRHRQVHGAQHVGQHMVRLNLQVVRLEFNGHMPVAQVVGGADQIKRRAMVGAMGDFQHSLRCGPDLDQRTVMGHQHIAPARHCATRQKDAELSTSGIRRFKAALLTHIPVQFNRAGAFEQGCSQALALGDEFGDVEHRLQLFWACPSDTGEVDQQGAEYQ